MIHLPQNWKAEKLSAIAELNPRRWSTPAAPTDLVSFVPMAAVEAGTGQMKGSAARAASEVSKGYTKFEDGDVLFAKITPCMENGKCVVARGLIAGRGAGSTEFHVVRPTAALRAEFLFYYLLQESLRREARAHMTGTAGQLRVPEQFLEQLEVPVPPREEQDRIVAKIEKQFTRLDVAERLLEAVSLKLITAKAAVLHSACIGRLVPQEHDLARSEGRQYQSADELLEAVRIKRRAEGRPHAPPLKTSFLPTLPVGWAWATWEEMSVRVTVGHVGQMKKEYVSKGVPFLRSQNVRENRFDPRGLLSISQQFHKALGKSTLHPGDLLVVRSGSVGVTCPVPETLPEANCADLVIIQQPLGVIPLYGSYYMNSLAKRHVKAGKVGIALTHFNTKSVAALSVAVPPWAEQVRIVAEAERQLSLIEALEKAVDCIRRRCGQLRSATLRAAFAGRLSATAGAPSEMAV